MQIKDYIKQFDKPFDIIKSEFNADFNKVYNDEKHWLGNLENKIHLLKDKEAEEIVRSVIYKLKSKEYFTHEDTNSLSVFIRKINSIVLIANRINNFKENTLLADGSNLKIHSLFNYLKDISHYKQIDIVLNPNLEVFLPHLFSIIKHSQYPHEYPIYYKYWKNILREVLNRKDDYDSMCQYYRTFPIENRQLNFASYLGTIGFQIASNIKSFNIDLEINSKDYKYLTEKVINIKRYRIIIDNSIMKGSTFKVANMREKFVSFLNEHNKSGSQKASNYIRSLDYLDIILKKKAGYKLNGLKSIFEINSIEIVEELYEFILKEQNLKGGLFENEEPSSYWKNKFYSAALNSYLQFLIINNKIDNENQINDLFKIERFESDCKESGLNYDSSLITRYIASLATKPFVLLSGLSGSGKTKLAEAFAKWICASDEQYALIPVGADWTNREPLLGYPNALKEDEYVKPDNDALDLMLKAEKDESRPYFLILDEMNLSHVERYFADFLSAMESKHDIPLHKMVEELKDIPQSIKIPKNLFIVGTVNIDETTYMFSPKVLDRANTIEFRVSDEDIFKFLNAPKDIDLEKLMGEGATMATNFVEVATAVREGEKIEENYQLTHSQDVVHEFFVELQKSGAEFGYRTAFEISKLIFKLGELGMQNDSDKLDIAIMQKMLPKLHGSRTKLTKTLKPLAKLCLVEVTGKFDKEYFENFENINFKDDKNIKYKLSFEKIMRMYKNAVENGFASYAEA